MLNKWKSIGSPAVGVTRKHSGRILFIFCFFSAVLARAEIQMTLESSNDGLERYSYLGNVDGRQQRVDLVKVPNPQKIDPAEIRPRYPIILSKHSAGLMPNTPKHLNIHHGPGYPLQEVFARQTDAVFAVNALFYHYSHTKYPPSSSNYILGDAASDVYTRMRDQYENGDFGSLDALLRIHRSIQEFEAISQGDPQGTIATLRAEFVEILPNYHPDKVGYVYQTYDKFKNGKSYHPLKLMRLDPENGMDELKEQMRTLRAAKYTFPTSPIILWDGQPVPFNQTGIVKSERGPLAPTPGTLGHMLENFNARTIMAFTRDDHILFLTVKGNPEKKPHGDFGMDFFDLQKFLMEIREQFGIVHAVGLDGGGSSQLMQRDFATNSVSFVNEVPDHEKQRPIGFSLMVMKRGSERPFESSEQADDCHQKHLEDLAAWLKDELKDAQNQPGKQVKQLVLVRHAESEANNALMTRNEAKFGSVGGNSALSELGRSQAAVIHRFLKLLNEQEDLRTTFEVSPLERTKETMGEEIRRYAREIPSLRERDRRPDGSKYPEPVAEFKQRVGENLDRWQRATDPDRIVVVGHSLFISELVNQTMAADCPKAFLHLGNTAVTVLHFQTDETAPGHLPIRQIEILAAGMVDHLPKSLRSGHHTAPFYMDEGHFPFSLSDRIWDRTHPGMIEALDHELILVQSVKANADEDRTRDIQTALAQLEGEETQFVVPSLEWARNSLPARILVSAKIDSTLLICLQSEGDLEQEVTAKIKSWRETRGRKRTVVIAPPAFIQKCVDELFEATQKATLRLDEGSLTIIHFTSNIAKSLREDGAVPDEENLRQFFEIQALGMRPRAYLNSFVK